MDKERFVSLTKDKFFQVCFTKADGSARVMNARCKIHKYIKGTGKPVASHLVSVWDRGVFRENVKSGLHRWEAGHRAYRSIKPETVQWIKVDGKTYNSEGEEIRQEDVA